MCLLLTREIALHPLTQTGLAACSQGRGFVSWLGAVNALVISLPCFSLFSLNSELSTSPEAGLQSLLCMLINLLQPEKPWHKLERSSAFTACLHTSHMCSPTLANSENLDGLKPTLFLLNSFRHACLLHTFLHQYPCHPWQNWGWMEAVILSTWAKLWLLPLPSHTQTPEQRWQHIQKMG